MKSRFVVSPVIEGNESSPKKKDLPPPQTFHPMAQIPQFSIAAPPHHSIQINLPPIYAEQQQQSQQQQLQAHQQYSIPLTSPTLSRPISSPVLIQDHHSSPIPPPCTSPSLNSLAAPSLSATTRNVPPSSVNLSAPTLSSAVSMPSLAVIQVKKKSINLYLFVCL